MNADRVSYAQDDGNYTPPPPRKKPKTHHLTRKLAYHCSNTQSLPPGQRSAQQTRRVGEPCLGRGLGGSENPNSHSAGMEKLEPRNFRSKSLPVHVMPRAPPSGLRQLWLEEARCPSAQTQATFEPGALNKGTQQQPPPTKTPIE